jgi:hypothetical protein
VELASIRLGLSCSLLVARAFPLQSSGNFSLHPLKLDYITKCGQNTRGSGSLVVFNGRVGFRANDLLLVAALPTHCDESCLGVRFLQPRRLPSTSAIIGDTNPKPVYNWILSRLGHPLNFPRLEREKIKAAPYTVVPVLPSGLGLPPRGPGNHC